MLKIHFYRPVKQEERDIYTQPFVQCEPDYVPAFTEPITIYPYPFLECFLTGDGSSSCHELFIEKFDKDLCTAERRVEECQKTLDQFINIRENYEF